MRLKLCMLLTCILSSTVNHECSSGNGSGKPVNEETPRHIVRRPPTTQVMDRGSCSPSYTHVLVQSTVYTNVLDQPTDNRGAVLQPTQTNREDSPAASISTIPEPILPEKPSDSQNQSPLLEPEKDKCPPTALTSTTPELILSEKPSDSQNQSLSLEPDKDECTGEANKKVKKEEEEEEEEEGLSNPTFTPSITDSNGLETKDSTLGFLLPPGIQFVHTVIEENLYTLLLYPSLSVATHKDVLATNKLSPLKEKGLTNGMKWLESFLNHWGKECRKTEQARAIFNSMEENKSDADFIKMGIDRDKKRIKFLMKRTNGKVLLLAVPKLSN